MGHQAYLKIIQNCVKPTPSGFSLTTPILTPQNLLHLKCYAFSPEVIKFGLSNIIKMSICYKTLKYAN